MTARRAASGASEPGTLHLVEGVTLNGKPLAWVDHPPARRPRKQGFRERVVTREGPGATNTEPFSSARP